MDLALHFIIGSSAFINYFVLSEQTCFRCGKSVYFLDSKFEKNLSLTSNCCVDCVLSQVFAALLSIAQRDNILFHVLHHGYQLHDCQQCSKVLLQNPKIHLKCINRGLSGLPSP